jgi:hypothetical protein
MVNVQGDSVLSWEEEENDERFDNGLECGDIIEIDTG